MAVDVARNVITEHRERQLAAAATMARNQQNTMAIAETYAPGRPKAPSATELAELGFSNAQEWMAHVMAAELEAAGGRRRSPLQDALDVGDLVYRPIRDEQ